MTFGAYDVRRLRRSAIAAAERTRVSGHAGQEEQVSDYHPLRLDPVRVRGIAVIGRIGSDEGHPAHTGELTCGRGIDHNP